MSSGQFGVLGYGDKLDRNRPIPGDYVNIHPSGRPIQIAAGGFHNCVLLHTGLCIFCVAVAAYHAQAGHRDREG